MVTAVKFRIKNYKSIKDSGDCYLAGGITVLAGKNESGKTSILEALEDFDINKNIRKEAKPINKGSMSPEIEITFQVIADGFDGVQQDLQAAFPNGLKITDEKFLVTILKNFDNEYSLIDVEGLSFEPMKEINETITLFQKEIIHFERITGKYEGDVNIILDALDVEDVSKVLAQISSINQNIEENKDKLPPEKIIEFKGITSKLKEIMNRYIETDNLKKEFLEIFKKHIPNFILFDTYNDQIPSKVPIAQLKENTFIRDLIAISDLKIKILEDPDKLRENLRHKDEVNLKVSEEYKKFWQQDAANLYFEWNKESLNFWIKENGEYYEPKQRSKGKQWHLSFYVRVTARSKEDVANIILIDEPGLFLHAKAQKDILKKVEESSQRVSIIFSTHSPYLIDSNKLNRVRLIVRSDEQGTGINKVHAKADKETLTPILTAIGEDLSQGIRVDKKNSFIVEGISDYYYLHAFSKIISFKKGMDIIPGCGSNIPAVACILFGWGLDPYFILDSDKSNIEKKLKEKLSISEDVIIKVLDEKGAIEDLFSAGDIKKFVLEDENADLSQGFIGYLKNLKAEGQNLSKELTAKKFFEKVDKSEVKKTDLSDASVRNIQALFDKIEKLIDSQNQLQDNE